MVHNTKDLHHTKTSKLWHVVALQPNCTGVVCTWKNLRCIVTCPTCVLTSCAFEALKFVFENGIPEMPRAQKINTNRPAKNGHLGIIAWFLLIVRSAPNAQVVKEY